PRDAARGDHPDRSVDAAARASQGSGGRPDREPAAARGGGEGPAEPCAGAAGRDLRRQGRPLRGRPEGHGRAAEGRREASGPAGQAGGETLTQAVVRNDPGTLASAMLSIAVRALLLIVLFCGIRWKTKRPGPVRAGRWTQPPVVEPPRVEPPK